MSLQHVKIYLLTKQSEVYFHWQRQTTIWKQITWTKDKLQCSDDRVGSAGNSRPQVCTLFPNWTSDGRTWKLLEEYEIQGSSRNTIDNCNSDFKVGPKPFINQTSLAFWPKTTLFVSGCLVLFYWFVNTALQLSISVIESKHLNLWQHLHVVKRTIPFISPFGFTMTPALSANIINYRVRKQNRLPKCKISINMVHLLMQHNNTYDVQSLHRVVHQTTIETRAKRSSVEFVEPRWSRRHNRRDATSVTKDTLTFPDS